MTFEVTEDWGPTTRTPQDCSEPLSLFLVTQKSYVKKKLLTACENYIKYLVGCGNKLSSGLAQARFLKDSVNKVPRQSSLPLWQFRGTSVKLHSLHHRCTGVFLHCLVASEVKACIRHEMLLRS